MTSSVFPARSLRALVLCGPMLCLSLPAQGTDPLYRITDLGELGFNPGNTRERRTYFGISNNGHVVFCRMVDSEFRAMLCLPLDSAYGLDPGIYDLNDLGFNMATPNVARDINVNGLVVGQVGGDGPGEGMAVVWNLAAEPEMTMIQLGVLDGSEWSSGFAVSDADPPVIVGESDIPGWCPDLDEDDCDEPEHLVDRALRSFYVELTSPLPDLTELGVLGSGSASFDCYCLALSVSYNHSGCQVS